MKNVHRLQAGIVLALTAGWLCSAEADVIVSYNASIPTENVMTSFIPSANSGLAWRDDSVNISRQLGQSFFVADNVIMDAFSVQANGNIQNGATEAPFTVTIYESATGGALGTVVTTQTGTFLNKDLNPISLGWITFDIENINLTGGNYYTFMLSWNNPGVVSQSQGLNHRTAGDEYTAGRLWQINGTADPTNSTAADLAFSVQVIPEPASVGLLAVGAALVMMVRKRFSF